MIYFIRLLFSCSLYFFAFLFCFCYWLFVTCVYVETMRNNWNWLLLGWLWEHTKKEICSSSFNLNIMITWYFDVIEFDNHQWSVNVQGMMTLFWVILKFIIVIVCVNSIWLHNTICWWCKNNKFIDN